MLTIVGAILITMMPTQTISVDANGMLDTVVVTAPRCEYEDAAWSGLMLAVVTTAARYQTAAEKGMMHEVVATAPRYEHEDVAWSGLMPEVLVTAPRFTIPTVLASIWPGQERFIQKWRYSILMITDPERIDTFEN
jgi:hypothetical protein